MKPHVLIVDDERSLRFSMKTALMTGGYKISTAMDGKEGLEKIHENENGDSPVSLIITDINMPGMNGLRFIDELKKLPRQIPIIVVTGYGDRNLLEELVHKGISGYLDKPMNVEALREKAAEIIDIDKSKREKERRARGSMAA
ncbi:MAG: response regulator [Nitrospinae bacterium]|nr:response regulator [Nitrospinota bacterium]